MTAAVIIPARLGSTRFPEKVIAASTGRPLVQHVVDRVRRCKRVREVLVATDDQRVDAALRPYGTPCRMTAAGHQSGTDRIAEVAADLSDEIIVNVQGDEPEIEPDVVDRLIAVMESGNDDMATVVAPFPSAAELGNPNLVKAVVASDDRAIYFSRAAVPFHRDGVPADRVGHWLHRGIYAYRRPFLLEFASWTPTPLEQAEKLEQLRALEHGRTIRVIRAERSTPGIDTPAQYEAFVERFRRETS